ncbi:MAG: hypothetical protein DHS20C06_00100 [Hyphobacterium sp.]|nr:MAG: hypothetical protein DHS20C06_00100 [Hyphobacterium sp.]
MRHFDWKLIMLLALPGVGFGVATIFAWIQGLEHFFMLAMIAGIGIVAALAAPARAGQTAMLGGFLAVLTAIWLQGVFLTAYFANNPAYADVEIPLGLSARVWTLAFAPAAAVLAGGLSLLVAFLVRRLTGRRKIVDE